MLAGQESRATALKREILEKVREYHAIAHAPTKFEPNASRVRYAGRVYGAKELTNLVDASLDFWLTMGPWGDEFEARMRAFFGTRDFAATNSGSTANLNAVMALMSEQLGNERLAPGDEVITPAVTFPTTLTPIVHGGMTPVFVDCELGTYNVDPSQLEAAVGPKTKAMLIPHTLGNPANLDAIREVATKHDLWVIEDTCDALGSTWRGKLVGTYGDLATLSFFPAHHMSCSPDTLIPFQTVADEKFHLETIEYIFANFKPEHIRIIAFNGNNELRFVQPSHIIKHQRRGKQMLRLSMATGRHVDVTVDHSVFRLDPETYEVRAVESQDISKGDHLVVPRRLPRVPGSGIVEIDFLKYCMDHEPERFTVRGYDEKNRAFIKQARLRENVRARKALPMTELKIRNGSEVIFAKGASKANGIPGRISVDTDLARLMGYYIAEGSYQHGRVIFSFNSNETNYIGDVQRILRAKFGLESTAATQPGTQAATVSVNSVAFRVFITETLGMNKQAKEKRVPEIVFRMPEECQISFLYGLCVGDGSWVKDPNHSVDAIELASASQALLSDVAYLCGMLGIITSTDCKVKGGSRTIAGRECVSSDIWRIKLNRLDLSETGDITRKPRKKQGAPSRGDTVPVTPALLQAIRKAGVAFNPDYVETSLTFLERHCPQVIDQFTGLQKLRDGDLCVLKVANVEKLDVLYEDVYDFSVPGDENFVGGNLPVCMHNTTGEGGGVITNNARLAKIVKSVRDWGRDCWCATGQSDSCGMRFGWKLGDLPEGYDHKYIYSNLGYNFKPTDLQCAIGVAQLDRLEGFTAARKRNFSRLHNALQAHSDQLILPRHEPEADPSWFGYAVTVQNGVTKRELVAKLEAANIETRHVFGGNILRQPAYRKIQRRTVGDLPNSDRVMRDTFFVGVYPGMTSEMIDHMIDTFHRALR